jgi:UDP-3-O-[3-hydroxymyristoyl] glucosamine N-acyltransferase
VVLAGQSGISGHLSIGDDAVLGPQSGVAKDVPAGAVMGGAPVMERGAFMRYLALVPKLPEMAKRLRRLEKRVAEFQQGPTRGDNDEG